MFTLDQFIRAVAEKGIHMDAVMAVQDGKTLGLHRFTNDRKHNVFSISKSFLSAAIGAAAAEGRLRLSDKPAEVFRDILPADADPAWQEITLQNLLTMTTGHGQAHLMAKDRKYLRELPDTPEHRPMREEWLLFAFTRPVPYRPGTRFVYGNLAPYVAGRMLERATGMTVLDYTYEKLWKPLGVEKPRWDSDGGGHTFPASDLFLDIEDMIKLGQIYLGGGVFEGRRYLPEHWVRESVRRQVSSAVINPTGKGVDEEAGYGYYFWRNQDGGFRAYGREGQFILVLPEKNTVIATQAMHANVQDVLDLVWEYLTPQL